MLTADAVDPVDTCLDTAAMRQHLRPLLAPAGAVDAVRVLKSRRSASRRRDPHPLVVLYEIDLRDAPGARPRTVVCHGTVFRAGASAQAAMDSAAAGMPAFHFAALDLLLWTWPRDPALPQLPALLESSATVPLVGSGALSIERLRYEPGRRATLRYRCTGDRQLYAKTFADERAPLLHRRFDWFWQRAQHDAAAPLVAEPLASDARTLWQAATGSESLRARLERGTSVAEWSALARAIAHLHGAPASIAGPQVRDTAHWLREVQRRRTKLGRVRPELAARADATASAIERAADHLPARELALIHGDFHVDQVALDDGRVVLFDFDEFALGDPMEDLAAFVVKLPDSPCGADAVALWLAAYAKAAPEQFCARHLAWHLAIQQLLQASRAFVFQVPGWVDQVDRRLERAEELAQAALGAAA